MRLVVVSIVTEYDIDRIECLLYMAYWSSILWFIHLRLVSGVSVIVYILPHFGVTVFVYMLCVMFSSWFVGQVLLLVT